MKTFLHPDVQQEIISRIYKLTPVSKRRWGTMTPHQMICHLADSTRVALGVLPVDFIGSTITRLPVFRLMALSGLPWPRGVLKTAPEIDQMAQGTKPAIFEADVRELVRLLSEFISDTRRGNWPDHPVMGGFAREDWGRQIYKHCDHHLTQFGV